MEAQKLLFSYNIIINELSSAPLLHGILFLKWKVLGKNKLSGYSPHFAVKDHEIRFDMSFHLEQEIELDRITNVLEDVILKIYVNQETEGGQEWVRFGMVRINLSEFAGARQTTKRFLLEQSKTNAALSVSMFSMLKSGGAPFFKVPESTKKLTRLEDEDDNAEAADNSAFRAHNMQETLMSDQRYMLRERENLALPEHIVSTRFDNAQVVEELMARVLQGIQF